MAPIWHRFFNHRLDKSKISKEAAASGKLGPLPKLGPFWAHMPSVWQSLHLPSSFYWLPSGKRLQKNMKRSTMLQWENQLFLWTIFNSYVKLPDGKLGPDGTKIIPSYDSTCHDERNQAPIQVGIPVLLPVWKTVKSLQNKQPLRNESSISFVGSPCGTRLHKSNSGLKHALVSGSLTHTRLVRWKNTEHNWSTLDRYCCTLIFCHQW